MRKIALTLGVVDLPNQSHKSHSAPVPYLGGVAIVVSTSLLTLTAPLSSDAREVNLRLALTILIPAILMALIGLIDDVRQLQPWPRFIAQNLIAIIATGILINSNTFGSPTGFLIIDYLISIVWLVGITNAINFFDNMDGGASGTVAISAIALSFLGFANGQFLIAAMSGVISGATIGFLIWNRPPAKIYMGDAGALFLGLLMASLLIRFDPSDLSQTKSFLIPLFLIAVPILDTSVAVLGRISRGDSPFKGGKDHLSHRILQLGVTRRITVMLLWTLTSYFAMISVALFYSTGTTTNLLMFSGALTWIICFYMFFFMKFSWIVKALAKR